MALAFALVGCGPGAETVDGTAGAGADTGARVTDAAVARAPLVAALGERLGAGAAGDGPAAPTWPADLSFHAAARAESIELVAVLRDVAPTGRDDRAPGYVVVRRFDRLSVRGAADGAAVGGDDFGFRDIVRTSVAVTSGAIGEGDGRGSSARRDVVERATLGLAGASEDRLHVRDATVARLRRADDAAVRDDGQVGTGTVCAASGHAVGDGGSALVFLQEDCPTATLIGPLVVATSSTLDVRGTLEIDGETRAVGGQGWVRRAWGTPPSGGGAVVFDRLLLELDGIGLVDVSRSKRGSGRGPRTTTATLRPSGRAPAGGAGADATSLDGVEWSDGTIDGSPAGDGVPSRWRLSAPSAGIDVVLEPLLDVPVTGDATGRAWRGGVVARGSHDGIGFVEFLPIAAAPAGAATPTAARP